MIDRTAPNRELVWKDGVILQDGDTRAEIIEARYRNEIRIRLSGKIKKPLLEKIRGEFDKIHASYGDRLRYQEYIPCNCHTCKDSQTPHSYALKRLEERLRNDRHEIECDISYQMVNVRGLIDDTIGFQPTLHSRNDNNDRPNINIHIGDRVGGDKMEGDKVGGDKTEQQ
jgi:internalin A